MTGKIDKLNWAMTIMNTVQNVFEMAGKTAEKMPESWKQKLPGILGWSLTDERIFNGVLGQLPVDKQVLIRDFLYKKCKDFERNRFINVVAGMEVIPGKPEEVEKKFDKDGNLLYEKRKAGSAGSDQRKEFLESFADVIQNQFGGDLGKAYRFCVSGRMIVQKPLRKEIKKVLPNVNLKKAGKAIDEGVDDFFKGFFNPFKSGK